MLKRGPWSEEEDDRLRNEYPTTNTKALAGSMGRPLGAVSRRASALKLRKETRYMREMRVASAQSRIRPRDMRDALSKTFGEHGLPAWVVSVRRHVIRDDDEEVSV